MTDGSPRRRDSVATRAALLEASAKLFAERGFDRTTVRDIAALAGVNQALLFRYFGSKDALFATVMACQSRELLEESAPERLVANVLRRMMEASPGLVDHPLWGALRSVGHDSAAHVIRQELGQDYVRVLSSLTDADDAELRADLVLAWLVGISMLRSMFGKEPLASADADEVARLVLRATNTLLERTDQ